MIIKLLSSLEKVFFDVEPETAEISELSMLKNERTSFQVAFKSDVDKHIKLDIKGIDKDYYSVYSVGDVPVELPCFEHADDFYLRKSRGMYPDILYPSDEIFTKKDNWYSFWIELDPKSSLSGEYDLLLTVDEFEKHLRIEIKDALLPEQKLIYTNWFHSDCICDYYGIKPFSEKFWEYFENFASAAHKHGLTCVLTPLFTPPLDTAVGHERTTVQLVGVKKTGGKYLFDFRNLKRWVEICHNIGIEYFEMSHFFTQWGAKHAPKIVAHDSKGREKKIFGWFTRTSSREYDKFLTQFSFALKKFIYANGIENNVFFHISDEPGVQHIKVYKKRAALIKRIFSGFPIMDALSDYDFYKKGYVDIPVPEENSIDKFYGNVEHFWTYYCCGQGSHNEPNRFIAMPSVRNRALGVLLYKYNVEGFLQWGFNFYNTQYSLSHIDPYKVSDAGGRFPAGDSFMVYPDKDGKVICSLRLKVFYDAFQDIRALDLLESKIGREKVLELLGDINFNNYPHNSEWIIELRNKVNSLV